MSNSDVDFVVLEGAAASATTSQPKASKPNPRQRQNTKKDASSWKGEDCGFVARCKRAGTKPENNDEDHAQEGPRSATTSQDQIKNVNPTQLVHMNLDEFNKVHEDLTARLKYLERWNYIGFLVLAMFVVIIMCLVIFLMWAHFDDSRTLGIEIDKINTLQDLPSQILHLQGLQDQMHAFVTKSSFQKELDKVSKKVARITVALEHYGSDVNIQFLQDEVSGIKTKLQNVVTQDDLSMAKLKISSQMTEQAVATKNEIKGDISVLKETVKMQLSTQTIDAGGAIAALNRSVKIFQQQAVKTSETDTKAGIENLSKAMASLATKVRGIATTASDAKVNADKVAASITSICFVKAAATPCPAASVEKTLWHWYYPDVYDPYCGGGGLSTENEADGSCITDGSDHMYNEIKGCCT